MTDEVQKECGLGCNQRWELVPTFPSALHLEGAGRDILSLALCRASKCLLVSDHPAAEVALPFSQRSVSSMVLSPVLLYWGEGQGSEAA